MSYAGHPGKIALRATFSVASGIYIFRKTNLKIVQKTPILFFPNISVDMTVGAVNISDGKIGSVGIADIVVATTSSLATASFGDFGNLAIFDFNDNTTVTSGGAVGEDVARTSIFFVDFFIARVIGDRWGGEGELFAESFVHDKTGEAGTVDIDGLFEQGIVLGGASKMAAAPGVSAAVFVG